MAEESDRENESRPESGHYGIVCAAGRQEVTPTIVNRHGDFRRADRLFSSDMFARRWWDYSRVPDPDTGRPRPK